MSGYSPYSIPYGFKKTTCIRCSREMHVAPDLLEDKEARTCWDCAWNKELPCECGARKAGIKQHSDWCKRYGLDAPQHPRKLSSLPAKEEPAKDKIDYTGFDDFEEIL